MHYIFIGIMLAFGFWLFPIILGLFGMLLGWIIDHAQGCFIATGIFIPLIFFIASNS